MSKKSLPLGIFWLSELSFKKESSAKKTSIKSEMKVNSISDFVIDFVKCDHGTLAPDAVGAVVTVDDKKIYYSS